MSKTYIYMLIDPISRQPRYIGKSNNPLDRLKFHIGDKRRSKKKYWIQNLRSQGLLPLLEIVDEVSLNEWQFWEIYWINQMKAWGFNLTNGTEGGEGGFIPITEEGRKRLSQIKLGNTDGFRKGHKLSPKVNPHSEDAKLNMRNSRHKRDDTIIVNLSTGVFYQSAREAYNSNKVFFTERQFRNFISGKSTNKTDFIKL